MQPITVQTKVQLPLESAWKAWTEPAHIVNWNHASDDWHTPLAENDLKPGGRFSYRMEARDGSFGFDFGGTYDEVRENEYIAYTLEDGRKVNISFREKNGMTEVRETFEPESENPVDMQRQGWQAILDNFRKYAENRY